MRRATWILVTAAAVLAAVATATHFSGVRSGSVPGRAEATAGPLPFVAPVDLPPLVRSATIEPASGSTVETAPAIAGALETVEDAPAVVITEVRLTPPGGEGVWVELVALEDVDLSDLVLTDLDGNDRPVASMTTLLKRGDVVIVHWDGAETAEDEVDGVGDRNGNGVRDLFLTRRGPRSEPLDEAPSRTEDQLMVLDAREGHNIIDAVCWSRDGATPKRYEGEDFASVVEAGQWTGAPLVGREEGVHFNRRWLQDGGTAADWTPGPLATAGRPNVTSMPAAGAFAIVEVAPREAKDRDWVEIEVGRNTGEGADLVAWSITDLDGAPTPLARAPMPVRAGERVLVHWNVEGRTELSRDDDGNGARDVYLGGAGLGAEADQCVLLYGHAPYDAVVWGEAKGDAEEGDVEYLTQAGAWRGDGVAAGRLGEVLARVDLSGRTAAAWAPTALATPGYPNVDLASAPRPGALVISEVHLEQSGRFWVELLAKQALDAAPYVLTDLDGNELPLVRQALRLAAGERLVVRWGKGPTETAGDADGNGTRDVFLDVEPPTVPADQIVLRLGAEIHDAIAWNAGTRWMSDEQKDLQEISTAGFRVRQENLGDAGSKPGGITLARAEGKTTWARAADATPGLTNDAYASRTVGRLALTAVFIPPPRSDEEAWAEITAVGGTSDISRCRLTDLDGADAPLADRPVTLRQGEKARVHWCEGRDETDDVGDADRNGIRDVYLQEQPPASTNDQIVLVFDGRYLDAVVWTDGRTAMPFQELEDIQSLIASNAWSGRYPDRRHPEGSVERPADGAMARGDIGRRDRGAWE